MKESFYNIYIEKAGMHYFYNTVTGALAGCDNNQWEKFCKVRDARLFEQLEEGFKNDLAYGGFIVDEGLNEFLEIESYCEQNRKQTETLGLTICPTMACNFACEYCFESSQDCKDKMTEKVQEDIFQFVKSVSPSHLSITWFGGEPLLAMDVIESLSKKFMDYCQEENVIYEAFLITNGYLLKDKNVSLLKELGVNRLQVTIDGLEEIHNRRRPLRGGGSTYKKIVENVKKFRAEDFYIHIRINVDQENRHLFFPLMYEFSNDDLAYISLGLGYVDNLNDTYRDEECLSMEEFYQISDEFDMELENYSSNAKDYRKQQEMELPSLISNVCGADRENSYGVEVDGSLKKCWNHFGYTNQSIGYIWDIQNKNKDEEELEKRYLAGFSTLGEECRICKLLPACLGGCIDERLRKGTYRCHSLRYSLECKVEKAIDILMEERSSVL